MKKNILLGAALLLLAASCTNDNAAQDDNAQNQEPGTEGLTAFMIEDDSNPLTKGTATRTTAEYDGSGLNFYWTAGDRLWVNRAASGAPDLLQDKKNNIGQKLRNSTVTGGVQRAARASFWFEGNFTASQYKVRYTGQNGTKDKVTIKAAQTQTVPNDASHLATDGDCGVATAQKQGDNCYSFMLDHKAAYITFMPYTAQAWGPNAVIQKIRVFTGNPSDALAGTFDFDDNGTLSNPASTSNSVELTVPDFSIPTTATAATNAATIVIAPGTYTNFTVEYTLHDATTTVTGTITKTYPSVTFTAGRNKKVKTDLQVTEYTQDSYYMWDAAEGQHYWYGHLDSDGKPDNKNNYPQTNTDPRYYREDASLPAPAANRSAKDCPNVNEVIWYTMQGDPHWDNELWATMRHLYKGGMWFLKKTYISGFTDANYNGTDYRTTYNVSFSNTPTSGKPSSLSNYFYLPAFGYYESGTLKYVGNYGCYWSSTPDAGKQASAYSLFFASGRMLVYYDFRYFGFPLLNKNNENQYRPNGL